MEPNCLVSILVLPFLSYVTVVKLLTSLNFLVSKMEMIKEPIHMNITGIKDDDENDEKK